MEPKQLKPAKQHRTAMLICLIIAVVIILCAATGAVCWQIRDRQAQMEVEQTN